MTAPTPGVVTLADIEPAIAAPAQPLACIAVLASLNFPDMTEPVAELIRRFTRVALESLHALGASYRLFDTSRALPDPAAVAACDGLLLLGGGDIDASCYLGPAELPVEQDPRSYGIDLRADRDGLAAIAAALAAGIPVLGICRGAQLLNVARGGSIIGDIADYALHHGAPGEPEFVDEPIDIVAGTRLASILGTDRVIGRSGHHQAVDRVGDGLVVAARALDGIVEGIEDPDRWYLGVQWHPEDDDGPAADRLRLFDAFVTAAEAARLHGVAVRAGSE